MSTQVNTMRIGSEPDLEQITDLVRLLQERAAVQPDHRAYTFLNDSAGGTSAITFADLDRRARAIAARLQQISAPKARVLLLYPSGIDSLAGFFGCLYADRIAIPVNLPRPNRPMPRLQAIVADAQATMALTTDEVQTDLLPRCQQISGLNALKWVTTDTLDDPTGWRPPVLPHDALAYLQYTSGSTSTPKGVMISHRNLLVNLAMQHSGFDHTPDSVIVSWLPMFHDMGLIYGALCSTFMGIHAVLLSPVSFLQQPIRWLQTITAYRGTHSAGPNFAYDLCVQKVSEEQRATLDLSSWQVAVNGAEPVRQATLDRFTSYFAPCGFRAETLCPCYGLAEATLKVSATTRSELAAVCYVRADALARNQVVLTAPDDVDARVLVGSGRTALDMQVAIVDPERQVRCAPDEVGEIWVSSSCVAQGYWQRPEETEQVFRATICDTDEGPFLRTGDLGFVHEGIVYITGRLKDVIIIRGRNLYPQDIELTVERCHEVIRQNCTAAFSIEVSGEEQLVIVGEVERRHRHGSMDAVVEAICQAVTEQHGVQVYTVALIRPGAIPKTSSGKIQRRACRAEFNDGSLPIIHQWSTHVPLTDQAQAQVVQQPAAAVASAPAHRAAEIRAWLVQRMADHARIAPETIDTHAPFERYRLDSLNAVRMVGDLSDWLGRALAPTLVYDYPSIEALSNHLAGEQPAISAAIRTNADQHEPIAIVGMGSRFPGAPDINAFWQLLVDGRDAVVEVPTERWDTQPFYDPTPATLGKTNSRWGGFLEQIDQFDAPFFSIIPREANAMDPQQRLLLEVAWEALEHAGIAPGSLAGTSAGVFVGISTNEYHRIQFSDAIHLDGYAGSGTSMSIAANRLSYLLNLHGPSLAIDTACSSSLVATHMACQSLRNGESSLALVGGVHLMITPELSVALSQAQMLSGTGRCKTFDASADGYVRGEGCGVVVLKRLSDAQRDGDTVYAVITGSAVNQDGRSNGLNAPNGLAQQQVIRAALRDAGVPPQAISYVEAHGTGTVLGDPIEVQALMQVLGDGRQSDQPCLIGSVKTNIGHLEAAAGIAGLIKTALALRHGEIPPHLHLTALNPYIQLDGTPFQVAIARQPWPRGRQVHHAGVSSFGFGGTNAHVVLEQAPAHPADVSGPDRPMHILALSARTETALQTLAARYVEYLDHHPNTILADLCATANAGRNHFAHRLVAVAADSAKLRTQLQAAVAGESAPLLLKGVVAPGAAPGVVWLFSGQGAQIPQMGRALYQSQPVFRAALDRCAAILQPFMERPLLEVIYPAEGAETPLHETAYTQPALFAFEYALAELWRSWGIIPAAVIGHSVGEYVAACVAGVFSLEDGLRLIAERARLMQSLPPNGRMAVVLAEETQVLAAIAPYRATVALAAVNGPANCTISGLDSDVDRVVAALEAAGVNTRPVNLSHAFHSPLMDSIIEEFESIAAGFPFAAPQLPFVSNLTGTIWESDTALDATYWRRHLREPVRFADGLRTLSERGLQVFLEIGPATTLVSMARACLPKSAAICLASLKRQQDDWTMLLQAAGRLYQHGVSIDWSAIESGFPQRRRLALPTSPFERKRHWLKHAAMPGIRDANISAEQAMTHKSALANQQASHGLPEQPARADMIRSRLRAILIRLLELDSSELHDHQSFLEIGADSIVLIHAIQTIQSTFGVEISISQMFENLNTLAAVAHYIDQQMPPEVRITTLDATPTVPVSSLATPTPPATLPGATSTEGASLIERVMAQQLAAFSNVVAQQLAVLQPGTMTSAPSNSNTTHSNVARNNGNTAHNNGSTTDTNGSAAKPVGGEKEPEPFVPYKAIEPGSAASLTPQQQSYLDDFVARYTARTAQSKQAAQLYQRPHADLRTSMHFHLATKELRYPIVAGRSEGAKVWDLDGNEYVDLTMGFGVNLFGHQEPFIIEALEQQIKQGIHVGPQSDIAGDVANLICELTGLERVTFCNSGSEAVMTALRIARAATGRTKIAIFAGSYHGVFDGILATTKLVDGEPHTFPMAPGIAASMVEDTLMLPYGTPKALEYLRAQLSELAAVLVEPVQSRRPDFQPKAFLQELRKITQEAGVALIFDEVITGFRIHPGGAQAHFGIRADLATYGKVIGGGMPIGAVAGKAAFMDAIDGGAWSFGDQSYPRARTTFYSGTFCKHPLAMAAGRAVLQRLSQEGPQLQARLNECVTRLAETLNHFFAQEQLAIHVVWFGSLFRFNFPFQMTLSNTVDLWFYHLVAQGIYVWEGRNCIISTAHTDADLNRIVAAVKNTVAQLRAGGFLPGPQESLPPSVPPREQHVQLTAAQQQHWLLAQLGEAGTISIALELRGPLQINILRQALQQVVDRHEALRTTISSTGDVQKIAPMFMIDAPLISFSEFSAEARAIKVEQWLKDESQRRFNIVQGPLLRTHILRLADEHHMFVVTVHHIVVDGWSLGVILHELGKYYSAGITGRAPQLEAPMQFREYVRWQQEQLQTEKMVALKRYWTQKLASPLPMLTLPTDRPRPEVQTYTGDRQSLLLSAKLCGDLKQLGRQRECTLFMTLLAGYLALLHRLSAQDDLLIGFPVSGRPLSGSEHLVGYCSHLVAIRSTLTGTPTFIDYLAYVKRELLETYDHQGLPFATLINTLNLPRDPSRRPLFSVTFNLERAIALPQLLGIEVAFVSTPLGYSEYELYLNITELDNRLLVEFDYNADLFDASTIQRMLDQFHALLEQIVADPACAVRSATPVIPQARQSLPVSFDSEVPSEHPPVPDLLEVQLKYWKEHLAQLAPLELPSDRPRPSMQSFRGMVEFFSLTSELSAALTALSRRAGVTLFMTLLAAFQELLMRYSGQEDFAVGTPIARRTHKETEGLIGLFINTLVLRSDLKGNPSFREVLGRVRETTLNAYAHQDLPFERLVEELQPQRDLSRNPLFQVMCTLQNTPSLEAELPGLSSALELNSPVAKFDLNLVLKETDAGLRGELEYSTDLFDTSTITRLVGHYKTLLAGAVATPDLRIGELPLLTTEEWQELVVARNETAARYPAERCYHHLFAAQAARTPDAIALVFDGPPTTARSQGSGVRGQNDDSPLHPLTPSPLQQLTYRELNERADRLAQHLRALGVGRGSRVGICMERSFEMVVGLLAIFKAGAAFVPIEPSFPRERIAYILSDARPLVLLTQASLRERLPADQDAQPLILLCLDTEWEAIAQMPSKAPAVEVSGADLAYLIYTSGSTGRPKGVLIPHSGLNNYLLWCIDAYTVRDGRGAPVHASIAADAIFPSLFAPLLVGTSVVLFSEERPLDALAAELIKGGGFSMIKITPSQLEVLNHQLPEADARGWVRTLVVGAEALRGEVLTYWQTYVSGSTLLNEYGPTETVVGCSIYPVERPIAGAVPIGLPIANTTFYVLDKHMQPLPVGVPGELYIGGDGVAWGYYNRPDLTAERFVPNPFAQGMGDKRSAGGGLGWGMVDSPPSPIPHPPSPGTRLYKTGDLVIYLGDQAGNIVFLGRMDDQVKIRGYRVEPGEIEVVLGQHPQVWEVAVLAREDVVGDKRLVAYVAPDPARPPTVAELRSFVQERLPDYMVPSAFVLLDALPLSPHGKVNRHALPAPDTTRPELPNPFVAPRTPSEIRLAAIWANVLGVEQVGIYDNFFALGGNSLLGAQIIARLPEVKHIDFPLRHLFAAPTVADFALLIEQGEGASKTQMNRIETTEHGDISLEQLLAEVNSLSDDAVLALLDGKNN